MLKEENTKKGLESGTISSISLIGDRTLVLLDMTQEHTTTESGIIIPLADVIEKDSGRLGTKISNRKHLSKGTVIKIADYAKQKFQDVNASIEEGDRVYVSEMVSKNVNSYQFFLDRDKLVLDFEGLVCIPHTLIEAKINTNG